MSAEDDLRRALDTPKGERLAEPSLPGYKGDSFFSAGMLVFMRCGGCEGNGCPECEWAGAVMVHVPEKTDG